MVRQQSRLIHLREGDTNTKLFHMQCGYRAKKKFIARLEHEGGVAITQEEKEGVMFSHFSAIMGTAMQRNEIVNLSVLGFNREI